VRAATGDSFDPRHWWRTTSDALDVVREALGVLNTWAGLPVHPARWTLECGASSRFFDSHHRFTAKTPARPLLQ